MNANQRQQMLLLLTGIVLVLFFSDRFLLTPMLSAWKERSVRIADLKTSMAQGALLVQRDAAIRERWKSMRDHTLPSTPSAAENELLKAFERWSQDSGMSLSSIKPQWREGGEDFLSLECRAEGFGSMEAVTRFLFEVEKDTLPVKVDTVEIVTRDPKGQVLTLGLQVSGLVLQTEKGETP